MGNPFRDYEAEIYDFKSGNHLSSVCTSTRECTEPYVVGEEFIVSDSVVFRNNSKRTRKCIIRKVERIGETNRYSIYVEPTKEDVKFRRNLLEDLSEGDSADWWKES